MTYALFGSSQNGFRQLRSTAQHVLAVRRIFESVRMTKDAKVVAIFVDFCKAFDSISWVQIEAILYAYQVPVELVQAVMSIYRGAKAGLRDSEGQVRSGMIQHSILVSVCCKEILLHHIYLSL